MENKITRFVPVNEYTIIVLGVNDNEYKMCIVTFIVTFTGLGSLEHQLLIYVARKKYRTSNLVVLIRVHHSGRMKSFEILVHISPRIRTEKEGP